MSLYELLCSGDLDLVQQALELIVASVAEVDSADEGKQLETLAQTLVVESSSSSRCQYWRRLLRFELNRIDELEWEDSVFRLDALIGTGLRFEHAWHEARGLGSTRPRLLPPSEFFNSRKSQFSNVVGRDKSHKEYPLALQTRVKLQRHYVNLYKSRDRTREVQHTLPYKAAAEVYNLTGFGVDFEEVYKLCLEASGGQGMIADAWKDWETSKHPIHFLGLASHISALTKPRDYDEDVEVLFEPKLLEFLQYELPKSSWRFFKRVNSWCTGFKMTDPEYIDFDLLHTLCQMDFPLSGKYHVNLAAMLCPVKSLWEYLPRRFRWDIHAWEMDTCDIDSVCEALQIEVTGWGIGWGRGWRSELKSRLNSFDTSHWTRALVKVVGENSPRHLKGKDLVQIFDFFQSGWFNDRLTSRQLTLVEKWIAESGCEKLRALAVSIRCWDLFGEMWA